jgi:hypothetical protein
MCLPNPRDETHLYCKQGQSRECPSGSKRVLHRLQLRTNYPAVGKETDGIAAPRVAHPLHQESDSRAHASPISVRFIQRTLPQPSEMKIVARFSLLPLDCELSNVRCPSTNPSPKIPISPQGMRRSRSYQCVQKVSHLDGRVQYFICRAIRARQVQLLPDSPRLGICPYSLPQPWRRSSTATALPSASPRGMLERQMIVKCCSGKRAI